VGANPRLFIPEAMTGIDGASGYLLVDGSPGPDDIMGIYGDLLHPARGIPLGNGWWYLSPRDG